MRTEMVIVDVDKIWDGIARRDITITRLAKESGVTPPRIHHALRERLASLTNAEKLAATLNIPLDEMIIDWRKS